MPPRVNESQIVDYAMACRNEVSDQRQGIEKTWDRLQALYLADIDNTEKKPWQFRVYPGQVWRTTKYAMALLTKILIQARDYFGLAPVGLEDTPLAKSLDKGLKFYLQRAEFLKEFRIAGESGLLYGLGVLKWGIKAKANALGQLEAELSVQSINPRDIFFPADESFFIHRTWRTIPEIQALAQAGVYDKGRVTKIINQDYRGEEYQKRMNELGLNEQDKHNKYRKMCQIDEFWGDVLGEDGSLVAPNQRVVIANEKWILKKGPNPYECGKFPFVILSPLRVIFRHLGAGIFDACENHQAAMSTLLNMMLDSVTYRILPMFEADVDKLEDPDALYSWEPGKVLGTQRTQPGEQVIKQINANDIPQGGLGLYQLLRQDAQNHTGVTDFIMSTPQIKADTTATEVATKTSQGNAYFEQVARDLEEQGIVKSVGLAADFTVQMLSMPISNTAQRVFSEAGIPIEMLAQSPEARQDFYGHWDVTPRGITMFFEKEENLQALMSFFQVVGQSEILQQYVKPGALMARFMDYLRIPDPDTLVMTDEEIQQRQMMQQQMQVQQGVTTAIDTIGQKLGIGGPPQQEQLPGPPMAPGGQA